MENTKFIKFTTTHFSEEQMLNRSTDFLEFMKKRKSIRSFSKKKVPLKIIENIILTASTAPSGANKQPWTFCVVANPTIKSQIRSEAEEVEKESYKNRMSTEWIEDLEQFETNWQKPYIDDAPYIIVVFKKAYDLDIDGNKKNNYYVNESVGIALGFLITAIHQAGLVTVTHTPSPMNFLSKILLRPKNERAYMLLPIGYPADHVTVPNIVKKNLDQVYKYY